LVNSIKPQERLWYRALAIPFYDDLYETYQFFRYHSTFGQKAAWVMFTATCLHLAFLAPYFAVIPGERAKVLSGILCALALIVTCVLAPKAKKVGTPAELGISAILTILMVLSSLFSIIPASSSARAFVILSSGLGGFWCARILLTDNTSRRIFRLLSIVLLASIICVSLVCYFLHGSIFKCLDVNPHPLASRILLLWFAPLSYVIPWGAGSIWVFGALVAGSYVIFYLSKLRSASLIPVALLFIAAALKVLRFRYLLALLLPLVLILVVFFLKLPMSKIGLNYEPAYYRVESYFFSFHIAAKHPLFGIGLRAPRDKFLENYEIRYPYVTKKRFTYSVKRIRTSENVFLSFLTEVGIPFTLIYIFVLVVLVTRLIRQIGRDNGENLFHPLVLLLPIVAGLLHYQVLDGLYHPQVSWFFHILLGLIPNVDRST
jgi:hypothetical protein